MIDTPSLVLYFVSYQRLGKFNYYFQKSIPNSFHAKLVFGNSDWIVDSIGNLIGRL